MEKPFKISQSSKIKNKKKIFFQMKFDPLGFIYFGENISLDSLATEKNTNYELDDNITSNLIHHQEKHIEINSHINMYSKNSNRSETELNDGNNNDYANGIRLLRLFENKIVDPEGIKFGDLEEDGNEKEIELSKDIFFKKDTNKIPNLDDSEIHNESRSKRELNQFIKNQKLPKYIIMLKFAFNILFSILIAMSFSEYFLNSNSYEVSFILLFN